jgi:predicted adenine nucleotide alpha hydrolase (AANH) superfamily ATPase
LTKAGFSVEGLFYNPNIQPQDEYLRRKKSTQDLESILNFKVYYAEYDENRYLDYIKSSPHRPLRCKNCFKLRLKHAHKFAEENKFDFFTTTLLVSPYQDQDLIKEISEDISRGSNTKFLFSDFRPGFRSAHNKAKELGLYCQKYCGCLLSNEDATYRRK